MVDRHGRVLPKDGIKKHLNGLEATIFAIHAK
jgi:hypothetical protein